MYCQCLVQLISLVEVLALFICVDLRTKCVEIISDVFGADGTTQTNRKETPISCV